MRSHPTPARPAPTAPDHPDIPQSEWGTSPAHWYFSSALPRALLATAVLVGVGAFDASLRPNWRVVRFLGPALGSICLYSALPHKELR